MSASHGNTPAAWTAVSIMFVGFLHQRSRPAARAAVAVLRRPGVVVLGAVVGKVMSMMGMGGDQDHPTGDHATADKGDPPRERLRQQPAARPQRAAPAAGLEPAVARPAAVRRSAARRRPAPVRPAPVRRPAAVRPAPVRPARSTAPSRSTASPTAPPTASPATPPPNYLVWAILTLIFCCWPLSIASIVFAAQVNGKYAAGDLAGAQESSRKAKQFALWSAIAACVLFGLLIALFIVGAIAGSNSNP